MLAPCAAIKQFKDGKALVAVVVVDVVDVPSALTINILLLAVLDEALNPFNVDAVSPVSAFVIPKSLYVNVVPAVSIVVLKFTDAEVCAPPILLFPVPELSVL